MKQTNEKPKLYVRMMGDFTFELDGERIPESFRGQSQFALMMQTILHHRKEGAERNMLVRTLFGEQQLDDVAHSLRNSLYLTKKKLKELGFPEVEFFHRKGNLYFWTDEIEVEEDAEQFAQVFFRASRTKNPEKRLSQMAAACRLYTGRFLADGGDHGVWMEEEADRFKGLFDRCMWEIDLCATQLHDYQQLYELARHAVNADPYACWEALVLKAMVAMDRFKEAETLFSETVARYSKKFGSRSAKQVREVEKQMGRYMMYQLDDINGIQKRLTTPEDQQRGGFVCEFPVFQELYRSVERVMNRFGGYIFLMVCTLVDQNGTPVETGENLDELSELLLSSIVRSVRHSDTIARYGKGQYLILLFGTNEENCSIIRNRIENEFAAELEKTPYQNEGVDASYTIRSVIPEQTQPGSFPFFANVGKKPEERK